MNVEPVHHPLITGTLLALAVAIAIVFSIGLCVMRDPYQRLHFAAPVVCFSVLFIGIAVWIEDHDAQARIKIILIGLILLFMNSILSYATARAVRIREAGHWEVRAGEPIQFVGKAGEAKQRQIEQEGKA